MNKLLNVFFDMDDTMFNFSGYYLQLFGVRPEDEKTKEAMWERIATVPRFFVDMPLMEGAAHFYHRFAHLHPVFLTHVPENDFGLTFTDIVQQKKVAVQQHGFAGLVIALPGYPHHVDKATVMQRPGDVLVDDWSRNIREWEAAGGHGILHRNWTETIAAVEWKLYMDSHPHEVQVS